MTGAPILTMTPFAPDLNLGRAYNEAMALLPDDGWACFLDHDAMFTTRDWYRQLVEAIAFRPDGAFTAVTNRIASTWQRAAEADQAVHDIAYHRRIGAARLARRRLVDVTETKGWGGVVMCLSKAAWQDVGGFVDGLLCVDHQMHAALRRAGRRVFLLEALYVYHWRRAQGDGLPAAAPRAACDCGGPERAPTAVLELPALTGAATC